MNREGVKKAIEQSHERGNPGLGFATTILALLAACATLLGHRAHTLEVRAQTQAADEWDFYQAKHTRAHMYGIEAEKIMIEGGKDAAKRALAIRYVNKSIYEQCGSPIDPKCNFARCGASDEGLTDADKCQVPVLRDSVVLQQLFAQAILNDTKNVIGLPKNTKEPSGAIPILAKAKEEEVFTESMYTKGSDLDVAEVLLEFSLMLFGIAVAVGSRKHKNLTFVIIGIGATVAATGIVFASIAYPWP